MNISNFTTQEVTVDHTSPEWTRVRYNYTDRMSGSHDRDRVLDITDKFVIVGDVKYRDMKEDKFKDIVELVDKWKAKDKDSWGVEFLNSIITERLKEVETLTYLERDKCEFYYEVRTPIYEGGMKNEISNTTQPSNEIIEKVVKMMLGNRNLMIETRAKSHPTVADVMDAIGVGVMKT